MGGEAAGTPAGALEGRGDQQRETIGRDEGARAGNLGVRLTDSTSTTGECREFWGNQEGQY